MSLHEQLDTYLAQRRALGFQLKTGEYLLRQFVGWLHARGKSEAFTIQDAVQWAREPADAAPVWWSQRLTAVRPFAAWLNANGVDVPRIPPGLLPRTTTRRAPFIYSQTDLDHLLTACPLFFPNARVAVTMSTIIGLLAATGLRIGEALRLKVTDLDVAENLLQVHGTKTPLDRLVPLHPSTTAALLDYLSSAERMATGPSPTGPIFVNNRGSGFVLETIEQHFAALVDALDLAPTGQPRPRLHDLRHGFATGHMIAAYTRGTNPARTLALLSTWLGHTGPEHTYWYLSAVPELLAAAAGHLEPALPEGEPSLNALAIELQTYFTTFAHAQRDLSGHTISAYRDTWRMLITFLAERTGTSIERIDIADIDAENITAFLDHLQHERGNSIATRNTRLCAIRAVLTHALPSHLEHAGTITRVLAIPPKRHPKPMLEFLTSEEADALIAAPDRSRWTGRRDHALLVLAIQTGLRISELTSLNLTDIHLGVGANVTCTGKGRRKRSTPLTSTTVAVMTSYLTERRTRPGDALFCGPHGQHLSRDALEHRLKIHTATAAAQCASIADKHVTMHTLRHAAAMNLLAHGVDISVIAIWLGHQSTQSTDAYLHADMAIKQAAIDRTRSPNTDPGTYQPEPDILAWLTTL